MVRAKRGFTLVELLVVMAIITLLVSILLPAVQNAREAGRRTQCLNNIKQLQLSILNYESANQHFPPGASESGAVWSAFVLPFLEEQALYDALTLEDETEDPLINPSGIRQWYLGSANLNQQASLDSANPIERNMAAIKTHVSMFLCPSASSSYLKSGSGVASVGPQVKLDPCYVVNASHCIPEDDHEQVTIDTNKLLDGAFTYGEGFETRRFVDGLSKTIFLGEVRSVEGSITDDVCGRFESNNGCRACGPICIGARVDRAFLGSDDLDLFSDLSEFFCTMGAVPNSVSGGSSCGEGCSRRSAAFELVFGSPHRGLTMFALGDGSARSVSDDIDLHVFGAYGTRYGSETKSFTE